MTKETAMKILKELHDKSLYSERTALETLIPELKESERIKNVFIGFVESYLFWEKDGLTKEKALTWLEKQDQSSDQIHYWTEEEIEPIINDYLRGAEHYGGMIGRLRCLKPKSLEKQSQTFTKKDVDDAYLKGICDAKHELEKQGDKSTTLPKWKYKKDNTPLLRDSIILNKYGGVAKSPSGAIISDAWVLDYGELAKLPKEEFENQSEQKPTSDTRYEVKNGDSLSVVNGKPFDYEHATITQKDFAPVGETATIELSSPIDCGDRIYHVSHKPIEKQGEQNLVEPKFKNGQWIVWQDKCYKVNYNGCGYELVDQNGLSTSLEYGTVDENAHLWDVTKDAKDGDVLVGSYGAFIFMGKSNGYCGVLNDNTFIRSTGNNEWTEDLHPATKEQRDLLFSKMKDAGYEFDFEKKELKKIEDEIDDDKVIKKGEKSAAWSDEDENMANDLIEGFLSSEKIHHLTHSSKEIADWLKSLKDRIGG